LGVSGIDVSHDSERGVRETFIMVKGGGVAIHFGGGEGQEEQFACHFIL